MSFNFSFSPGHLMQTGVYFQNGETTVHSQPKTASVSKNIRITLYPRWYKHVVIDWVIPADWGNCSFNVYFCQASTGPFQRLNPTPITSNHLTDTATQEYSKLNKGFYVVEAILHDKDDALVKSEPTTWDTDQNNWVRLRSQEVQRREYLLLRKFTGTKSYLFKRKNYGERCPECWDPKVGKSLKDHCKTCFGTSFKGGYFPCYPTLIQYDPSPNSNIKTYFGVFEANQTPAWTISLPDMQPDDIIVRHGEWDLYKVTAVARTELQSKLVRQMLQLTELSKHSVEYQLLTKNIPDFPSNYL